MKERQNRMPFGRGSTAERIEAPVVSEAGDRLKETVDVGAEQAKLRIEPSPEKKRQRAQGPHQKPDQGNGEEALPGKEVVVAAQMGQDQPYGPR